MNTHEARQSLEAMVAAWPRWEQPAAALKRWADRLATEELDDARIIMARLEVQLADFPTWSQWCEQAAILRREKLARQPPKAIGPPDPERVERCRPLIADCRAKLAR